MDTEPPVQNNAALGSETTSYEQIPMKRDDIKAHMKALEKAMPLTMPPYFYDRLHEVWLDMSNEKNKVMTLDDLQQVFKNVNDEYFELTKGFAKSSNDDHENTKQRLQQWLDNFARELFR